MRLILEVLLVATGFTGALTAAWLIRLVKSLTNPPPSVTPHFAPSGGCTDVLVREIGAARKGVAVLAGQLASRPVAQALVDARLRGTNVEILLDPGSETAPASEVRFLVEQGLTPQLADRPGLCHQAFLIDGKTLLVASYPLAGGGESEQAGSLLVVKGNPEVAAEFQKEHARLQDGARTLTQQVRPASPPEAAPPVPATSPPPVESPTPAPVKEVAAPPEPPTSPVPRLQPFLTPAPGAHVIPVVPPAAPVAEPPVAVSRDASPAPSESVLDSLARSLTVPRPEVAGHSEEAEPEAEQETVDEEESGGMVSMGAADLLARLRKQMAEQAREAEEPSQAV